MGRIVLMPSDLVVSAADAASRPAYPITSPPEIFTRLPMETVMSAEPGSVSVRATMRPCVQFGFPSLAWQGAPDTISVQLVGARVPSAGLHGRRIGSKS